MTELGRFVDENVIIASIRPWRTRATLNPCLAMIHAQDLRDEVHLALFVLDFIFLHTMVCGGI